MGESWILVTPVPGRDKFDPRLLISLFGHHAPDHIWMIWRGLCGFAMKAENYGHWMENFGPIELVSPNHVRIYRLECDAQADALILELKREFNSIFKEHMLAETT